MSESRAVDVVKAENLIEQSKKPGGIDPLLVIIRDWPKLTKEKGRSDLLPSLEHFVSCVFGTRIV